MAAGEEVEGWGAEALAGAAEDVGGWGGGSIFFFSLFLALLGVGVVRGSWELGGLF